MQATWRKRVVADCGEVEEKVGRGITSENAEKQTGEAMSKVSEKKQREKYKTVLKFKAGVDLDVCLYDLMTHSS